uniref:Ganglioside-induced differentiation-associated protein 1 n=1 Tax=Timema bartmani TaxID=61472 RepID=A0A7R9EXG2_9NEOP|nr:unnamed protein product [Timema bartmani]
MAVSGAEGGIKNVSSKGNGLLLYHHHYSFYSQKVVMALNEKKLSFESHLVNLAKGEQYQSWFININPRGEVPVLTDGVKVIPDSGRIIDYLEDNFSNGDTPRLIPLDLGPEVRQKVTQFRNTFELIPAGAITMGSFLHPEFIQNPRLPFIQPIRRLLLAAEKSNSGNLRELAENNPEAREILLRRAENQDAKHAALENKEEFKKVLRQVDVVLNNVEKELSLQSEDKANHWLCCERFTVADVSLTILLDRLARLGLATYFWGADKKPCLKQYYHRVQLRDSYKKTVPSTLLNLKMLFMMKAPLYIGIGAVTIAFVAIGGVFLFKKSK